MSWIVISQIGLWLVSMTTLMLVVVLYRQFGLAAMSSAAGHDNDGVSVGDLAPDLYLHGLGPDDSDRFVDLDYHWSVLVFATPTCEPCIEALDQLNDHAVELKDRQVQMLVALQAPAVEDVRSFAAEHDYAFDLDVDVNAAAGTAWQVKVTPFAFIVGPDGRVRAKLLVGGTARFGEFMSRLDELVEIGSASTTVLQAQQPMN